MIHRYLVFILMLFFYSSYGQKVTNQAIISGAPNVFMDCGWTCDFDNIRNNIKTVNFVRDRQSSDLHVLLTNQKTGTGGDRITLYFSGLKRFKGQNDTLFITTENDNTQLKTNREIIKTLKKGLLPYLLQTPVREKIQYSIIGKSQKTDKTKEIVDPWNGWVFNIGTGGFISSESNYNNYNLRGNISANKVTIKHKIRLYANTFYRKSIFYFRDSLDEIIPDKTITSIRKNNYLGGTYIYGYNEHLSGGVFYSFLNNLYKNFRYSNAVALGIEYNYYNYNVSDRKQLIFQYKLGSRYNQYVDSTIYNRLKEYLFYQKIGTDLYLKQNWGTVSLGVSFNSYLHDIRLNNLSFYTSVDWNIVKGLTIGINANLSFINDQINLPKKSYTVPDVILRNKLIATNYSLFGFFNIRYSFGSKYNNVVNSRFSGGGNQFYYSF